MAAARVIEKTLDDLKKSWEVVTTLSDKQTKKLEAVSSFAVKFNTESQEFELWLTRIEGSLSLFENVSTILEALERQKEEFKDFAEEIDHHRKPFKELKDTGNKITETCSPEDAELVNQQIEGIEKRWKDLNATAKQRKRSLDENYTLSKQFFEGTDNLLTKLDEIETKMKADQTTGKDAHTVRQQMRKHKVRHELQA